MSKIEKFKFTPAFFEGWTIFTQNTEEEFNSLFTNMLKDLLQSFFDGIQYPSLHFDKDGELQVHLINIETESFSVKLCTFDDMLSRIDEDDWDDETNAHIAGILQKHADRLRPKAD